jgi:peptidoglycan-N-acetylglucosamine deacetylase
MASTAKYRWLRVGILTFAAIAPFWTILFFRINLLIALVPLFFSHLLLLYPTLRPQSQWWGPVFQSFATTRREVWITIDDGPTVSDTTTILDLLDRFHARATFFVVGQRAAASPLLIDEILARGHQVANHTFAHPSGSFWCALPYQVAREIDRCASLLPSNLARSFFRAPAGLTNPFVHPALARRAMALIGWTIRGFDAFGRDPEKVAARILEQARPGSIILLHEGHQTKESPGYNPACVERTLQRLVECGYQFVIPTLEQLRTGER